MTDTIIKDKKTRTPSGIIRWAKPENIKPVFNQLYLVKAKDTPVVLTTLHSITAAGPIFEPVYGANEPITATHIAIVTEPGE